MDIESNGIHNGTLRLCSGFSLVLSVNLNVFIWEKNNPLSFGHIGWNGSIKNSPWRTATEWSSTVFRCITSFDNPVETRSTNYNRFVLIAFLIFLSPNFTPIDKIFFESFDTAWFLKLSPSAESSKNFSINTRDYEGRLDNRLFLGHDKLEVLAHHFRVLDTHGGVLFGVNKNEVTVGANALNVEGEGGAIFRESIQTPFIRAEPGKELRWSSAACVQLLRNAKIAINLPKDD